MREKSYIQKKKLKLLAEKLECNQAKAEYNVFKKNLNVIFSEIANGIKIRSRYNCHELARNESNKFFLNLEKYRANHNILINMIHDTQ